MHRPDTVYAEQKAFRSFVVDAPIPLRISCLGLARRRQVWDGSVCDSKALRFG